MVDIKYKWSKILAAKRYGGKEPITLTAVEQDELLQDMAASRQEGLKWVKVEEIKIVYGETYYAKWIGDGFAIKSTGHFRHPDDTFIWHQSNYVDVVKDNRDDFFILDETPTSPTPGNSERMAELENENVELREVVRQLNAGMIHFSTLDKIPTLDLLDRKAVIAHVVNIGKKKVINPKDTNQPYYSDSERMEKEAIGLRHLVSYLQDRFQSIYENLVLGNVQEAAKIAAENNGFPKSKPMDKEGEK